MMKRCFALPLVVGMLWLLAGCSTSLRDNLQETQAEDIVALLQQEGVPASKQRANDGTWSVVLKEAEQGNAEQILRLYDLPRQSHQGLTDIFPGTGLLPSDLEEHARYQYALGQELASTIERIDGVLSANVQVALPPKDPKQTDPPKPTASAFVRYRSDQRVDLMKSQIRTLIARGISGVSADDVSVFTLPVYPPPRNQSARVVSGWFGVRYVAADSLWVTIWFVLPWLIVAALVAVVVRLRGGLPAGWHQRVLKQINKRLKRGKSRDAFGTGTRPPGPRT
jgi:type III secretion protein J